MNTCIKNIKFNPIKVDEKLFRGASIHTAKKIKKMKSLGVTQIIDLRNTSGILGIIERILCKIYGIKYVNYKYPYRLNGVPDIDFFEKINHSIVNNNGKTYIHCRYGKRRTGVAVAIYEKKYTNKSHKDIIENMLNIGYKELLKDTFNLKREKLKKIFSEFIKKYFPDYKNSQVIKTN